MKPHLSPGEFVLFQKKEEYERGDIIFFSQEITSFMNMETSQELYVRRIIGKGGDILEINNGEIFLTPNNGQRTKTNEKYLRTEQRDNTCGFYDCAEGEILKYTIPEGKFFVMGDERSGSVDSRSLTWNEIFVDTESIIGKGTFVIYPLENTRTLPKVQILP